MDILGVEEVAISILAPREGSDTLKVDVANDAEISILAPREGSDRGSTKYRWGRLHFIPRSP